MVAFFVDIAGLTLHGKEDGSVRLGGSAGGEDLRVVEAPEGAATGLRSFSFVVPADCDIAVVAGKLGEIGVDAVLSECPEGPLLTVTDPDGFRAEFFNLPD